jgi:hypothetical protein
MQKSILNLRENRALRKEPSSPSLHIKNAILLYTGTFDLCSKEGVV